MTEFNMVRARRIGTGLLAAVSCAMATAQTYPPGYVAPIPDPVISGSDVRLTMTPDFQAFMDTTRAAVTAYGAAQFSISKDPDGFYTSAGGQLPLAGISADTTAHALTGLATAGGVTLAVPYTVHFAKGGTLTIADLRADFQSGLVYGDVMGADSQNARHDVPLWSIDAASTRLTLLRNPCPNPGVSSCGEVGLEGRDVYALHVDLTNTGMTPIGLDIFKQYLGLSTPAAAIALNITTIPGSEGLPVVHWQFDTAIAVPAGWQLSVVPEPDTWALMGVGLTGMFAVVSGRRRSRQAAFGAQY